MYSPDTGSQSHHTRNRVCDPRARPMPPTATQPLHSQRPQEALLQVAPCLPLLLPLPALPEGSQGSATAAAALAQLLSTGSPTLLLPSLQCAPPRIASLLTVSLAHQQRTARLEASVVGLKCAHQNSARASDSATSGSTTDSASARGYKGSRLCHAALQAQRGSRQRLPSMLRRRRQQLGALTPSPLSVAASAKSKRKGVLQLQERE